PLNDRFPVDVSRTTYYGLVSDYDDVEGDRVMARLEHDITDNFTITNQTVWDRASRDSRYVLPTAVNAPLTTATTQLQYYDRVNEMFRNQPNVAGTFMPGPFGHTISTGVEYTRETSDANSLAAITNPPGGAGAVIADLFDPDPSRAGPIAGVPAGTNSVDID